LRPLPSLDSQPVWWQLPERRSRLLMALRLRLPLQLRSALHWQQPSELHSLWLPASR
jgi:hypothetical protein